MVDFKLPGNDQLLLDGMSRREVHSYKKDLPTHERQWHVRRTGGYHDAMRGRGPEWLEWARARFSIGDDGWLAGDLSLTDLPRAVKFWVACEARLRMTERQPDAAECAFVFDKLLQLEAELPVTHFCASDGTRKLPSPAEVYA